MKNSNINQIHKTLINASAVQSGRLRLRKDNLIMGWMA